MIKFNCPQCGQNIEAPDEVILEKSVACPSCETAFEPKNVAIINPESAAKIKEALKPEPARVAKLPVSASSEIPDESVRIRQMASVFVFLSIFSLVIAGFSSFLAITILISGDERRPTGLWMTASGFLGGAGWCFLLAQLIHIRALLARDRK